MFRLVCGKRGALLARGYSQRLVLSWSAISRNSVSTTKKKEPQRMPVTKKMLSCCDYIAWCKRCKAKTVGLEDQLWVIGKLLTKSSRTLKRAMEMVTASW